MNPAETAAILRQFNEWRRGDEDIPQFDPRDIGEAIDAAVEMIERLEAAEKERDAAELMSLALRARIEQMERQEPVAEWVDGAFDQYPHLRWSEPYKAIVGAKLYTKLYALPGAQPAPSINEGVRKVTLGFRWESEAQHHIPTIEIEFDPVSPNSPNDAKSWQDRDRLAAMLTPEAKP